MIVQSEETENGTELFIDIPNMGQYIWSMELFGWANEHGLLDAYANIRRMSERQESESGEQDEEMARGKGRGVTAAAWRRTRCR
jgi:hypothetical protein